MLPYLQKFGSVVLFAMDMKTINCHFKSLPLCERRPHIYWTMIVTLALVVMVTVCWIVSIIRIGDDPKVENCYLEAIAFEREWVCSENPKGDGGVIPTIARKRADKALEDLKNAVSALPKGESASLRVQSYIHHRCLVPSEGK